MNELPQNESILRSTNFSVVAAMLPIMAKLNVI